MATATIPKVGTGPPPPTDLQPVPDIDLDSVQFAGATLTAQVKNAIEDAGHEQQIEGASTVTFQLRDSQLDLLQSGIFDNEVTLTLGSNLRFALASVSKQNRDLTVVFEDAIVTALRKKKGYRKADRAKVTRAEFVYSLLREVKEVPWQFYSPELHKKQPIASPDRSSNSPSAQRAASTTARTRRTPGFPTGARLTVKHAAATGEQRRTIDAVLSEGFRYNVPTEVLVAMVMLITQEREATNRAGGGAQGATGAFQQTAQNNWRGNLLSIPNEVHNFLFRADIPGLSFLKVYAAHHGRESLGSMIDRTQRAGTPGAFQQWQGEAQRTVATWLNGATAGSSGGTSVDVTVPKAYAFERKPNEDSWTCIQRLAQEVQWRFFVVGHIVYFIAEPDLLRSAPRMALDEDSPGVDTIDFTYDRGQKVAEATVSCFADLWDAPPGSVVELQNLGPANGPWLVNDTTRNLFKADCTITLKQPQPKLPEPAPETTTVSGRSVSVASAGGGSARGNGKGAYRVYFFPLPTLASLQRVDRGQDMESSGAHDYFVAMGDAKIIDASTGFPGIIYELLNGPLKGWHIFNGHTHESLVRNGQQVKAGQRIGRVGHQGAGYDGSTQHIEIGKWPVEGGVAPGTHHTISGSKMHHALHNGWPDKVPYHQMIG